MRLTLRTLLAYLDQILDAEDAQELEKKIAESEVATQLVQRIRRSLKDRKTRAILVDAEGRADDANSVSEYLDNTLPVDEIPEFERVCLESDDHLAEVAACHQILTLVLGEPAEVPANLKQRIYRLQDASPAVEGPLGGIARAAPSPDPVGDVMADLGVDGVQRRIDEPTNGNRSTERARVAVDEDERWTEAPDYLKRPRRSRWKPALVTLLIVFSLAMAGLLGMGPLNRSHPIAQRLGWSSPPEPSTDADLILPGVSIPDAADSDSRNQPAFPDSEPAVSGEMLQQPDASVADPTGFPIAADPLGPPDLTLDAPTDTDVAADTAAEPAEDFDFTADAATDAELLDGTRPDDLPAGDRPLDLPPGDTDIPLPLNDPLNEPVNDLNRDLNAPGNRALTDADASAATTAAEPSDVPAAEPTADAETGPSTTPPLDALVDNAQPPPTLINPLADPLVDGSPNHADATADDLAADDLAANDAADASNDVEDVSARPAIVDVGRFLHEKQVLVRFNSDTNQWERVTSGSPLQVGQRLATLPTFRTPLALASGLQVTLVGPTRVNLMPTEAIDTPAFELNYGRLLIASVSQTGTTFGLNWGSARAAVFSMTDMDTTVAVEVRPQHVPGSDPTARPPHRVLHVYLTSGSAEWSVENSPAIQITAGQRLSIVDDGPAQLSDLTEFPDWIDGRDARPRDPIAAADLAERLTADRSIDLVLSEEAESRYVEVRSLAVCSLAQLGDFAPLMVAMNDPKLRSYWNAQYEVLIDCLGRSVDDAAAIRQTLHQRHGEETGEQLFRLLWGYSPQQLREFGAEDLVSHLDHASSDFRVAAGESLKRITGIPSLYRAHAGERDPQRRSAIVRWRRHLTNDEIVYVERPEIVQLLAPSGGN